MLEEQGRASLPSSRTFFLGSYSTAAHGRLPNEIVQSPSTQVPACQHSLQHLSKLLCHPWATTTPSPVGSGGEGGPFPNVFLPWVFDGISGGCGCSLCVFFLCSVEFCFPRSVVNSRFLMNNSLYCMLPVQRTGVVSASWQDPG